MFLPVTMHLLEGFWETVKIFILTLVFALPLGLVVSFGSMSKWAPFRFLTGTKLDPLSRPCCFLCRWVLSSASVP